MRFMELVREKSSDYKNHGAPTIAFFGDSVTQGCFEIYAGENGKLYPVYDSENGYHSYLRRIFALLFPAVPLNIVNAGISGDRAPHALTRIDRDVIAHKPDLTIVSFGLNDSMQGLAELDAYRASIAQIIDILIDSGCEVIFMTANTMARRIDSSLTTELERTVAAEAVAVQNNGVLETYFCTAKELCAERHVPVCDCFSRWMRLEENGVDTTGLLANKINHPSREMNWLFAVSLFETILNS